MDWARGYTSEYYMTVVDPATWRDISRIEITGGSIRRETDGLVFYKEGRYFKRK